MADIKKELNDIKNAVYGREVRGSIHDGIKKINDEVENATDLSESAKHQVENIQQQVNQLVVEGDSSVEAAQARVDAEGKSYPTLKARLDEKETQLSSQLVQIYDDLNQRGVNVKSFGAVGDGVTDDTQAFIDAINASNVIVIPHGTYFISSKIVIDKNMTIIGEGSSASILKPSSTLTDYLLSFEGASSAPLKVSVVGIGVDGSNHPGGSPLYGGLRFDTVNSLKVDDVAASKTHDFIILYRTQNFSITNVYCEHSTASGVVLFAGCTDGLIKKITVKNCDEAVDLNRSERVTIEDVFAFSDILNEGEVVDVGGSKDITISNVVGENYYNGVTLKAETNTNWENITIVNCKIKGFTNYGIVAITHPSDTFDVCANLTIDKCVFESDADGAGGIYVTSYVNKPNVENVIISGNVIDVEGKGILARQTNNSKITNNTVTSTDKAIFVEVNPSKNVLISDNIVKTLGDNTAIHVTDITYPTVVNNLVESGGVAIHLKNCLQPYCVGNKIVSAGGHGIHLYWTDDGMLDSVNRIIGAVCSYNEVKNFGNGPSLRAGIRLEVNINTSGAYNQASLSNNNIFIDKDGKQNDQFGIVFYKNENMSFIDYVMMTNNTIMNTPRAIFNTGILGENSINDRNMIKTA